MKFEVHRRYIVSPRLRTTIYAVFLVLGIAIFVIIELVQGISPSNIVQSLITIPFQYPQILVTLRYMIPIGISAIGLLIVYRAGIYSIGAEGQMVLGAVLCAWIAQTMCPMPSPLAITIALLFGAIGGAIWGLIPGLLKGFLGANEIITTLMMNFIAYSLVEYLIYGPWRSPTSYNFPFTNPVPDFVKLPVIGDTRFSPAGLAIFLVLAVCTYILIFRTKFGFEVRAFGLNPDAAHASGMSFKKVAIVGMTLSGLIAGIAGAIQLLAVHHYFGPKPWNVTEGLGYTAILAAWLGGLNPLAVIATSFLLGALVNGSFNLRALLNQPSGVVDLMVSTILLSIVSAEFFLNYRIKLRR